MINLYRCMTADELALWQEAADHYYLRGGRGARTPCSDCPASFRAAARKAGTCRIGVPSPAQVELRRLRDREHKRASRARRRMSITTVDNALAASA